MIKNIKTGLAVVSKNSRYLAKFLNPDLIVSRFNFMPGMKVAHFGCGSGYFTFPIAKKVGPDGKVYALDVLSEKIEAIQRQARMMRLGNVKVMKVNLEKKGGSEIDSESVDWVVIVNMLYQNDNKNRVILEAERILKIGGCILFIDWKPSGPAMGPETKKRVSKEEMIKLARRNSLGISKEIEASDYHFGMVLQKIGTLKKEEKENKKI